MQKIRLDITMSLDGCVAGPNPSAAHPLGEGGEESTNGCSQRGASALSTEWSGARQVRSGRRHRRWAFRERRGNHHGPPHVRRW